MSSAEMPAFAAAPPAGSEPSDYDWEHRITYLRLLDADADGAPWQEVAQVVMGLDPENDPQGTHAQWRSHLDRAIWMSRKGYSQYLVTSAADGRLARPGE